MAWFSLKYYNFKIIDTRALQQKLQVVMRLISAKRCNTFWHFMIILLFFKKPLLDALLLLVKTRDGMVNGAEPRSSTNPGKNRELGWLWHCFLLSIVDDGSKANFGATMTSRPFCSHQRIGKYKLRNWSRLKKMSTGYSSGLDWECT